MIGCYTERISETPTKRERGEYLTILEDAKNGIKKRLSEPNSSHLLYEFMMALNTLDITTQQVKNGAPIKVHSLGDGEFPPPHIPTMILGLQTFKL
jgi:hypothetical protein